MEDTVRRNSRSLLHKSPHIKVDKSKLILTGNHTDTAAANLAIEKHELYKRLKYDIPVSLYGFDK